MYIRNSVDQLMCPGCTCRTLVFKGMVSMGNNSDGPCPRPEDGMIKNKGIALVVGHELKPPQQVTSLEYRDVPLRFRCGAR